MTASASIPRPDSLTTPGLAVVIGANGGLGVAMLAQLERERQQGAYAQVLGLGRHTEIGINFLDEASIASAAQHVAAICSTSKLELRLLVVATGFLHGQQGQPERSFAQLDANYLTHVFAINTLGPALVMKHFFPLLPKRGRCVAGFLSARVGSISDNALGGWYGYRSSKAALNQLVKTASIELTRWNLSSICVALHPGTVDTKLSQPFAKTGLKVRTAEEAVGNLLDVLKNLVPADTGALVDYQGKKLLY